MSRRSNPKLKLQQGLHTLRRAAKWPIWADLVTRLGIAFLLIGVVVLVHWIDRAGLKDSHDGQISFLDVVYFTMISVTTTGFGDIVLQGTAGRMIAVIIMIFGVSLFLRLVQVMLRPQKVEFKCPDCGLMRHDYDAVHCKACGRVLNIENEGV